MRRILIFFTVAMLLTVGALKMLVRLETLEPEQMRLIWPLSIIYVAGCLLLTVRQFRRRENDQRPSSKEKSS